MATATQPTIAHGIARFSSDQQISTYRWTWGPEWHLPPDRSGRWVIDRIYNTAIRVEFSDDIAADTSPTGHWKTLETARDALSPDEQAKQAQWLEWADQRESAAFVQMWNVRKRREHGDLPVFTAGQYVRRDYGSGVWHIATGRNGVTWDPDDRMTIVTRCRRGDVCVDLGDDRPGIVTTDAPDRVCRYCERLAPAAEPVPVSA